MDLEVVIWVVRVYGNRSIFRLSGKVFLEIYPDFSVILQN